MAGFEPGSSGAGIDHSTNCTTTNTRYERVFDSHCYNCFNLTRRQLVNHESSHGIKLKQ